MGIQLLNWDDIEQLRTSSVLSMTPMAQTFATDQGPVKLVAVHNWVLPKDLFVTLWMWYMLDGKIYSAHVDHNISDQILAYLNPAWFSRLNGKNRIELLNQIWTKLYHEYRESPHDLAAKREIFHRILDELAQD